MTKTSLEIARENLFRCIDDLARMRKARDMAAKSYQYAATMWDAANNCVGEAHTAVRQAEDALLAELAKGSEAQC